MNKLVWIGVAAVAAVLLFMVWMYSTFIDSRPAPPDRFKQIDNTTTTRTTQPPPAATAVKPPSATTELPFNASSYEVNYTLTFMVSLGGITMTMEGWMVIGAGPSGNYSFGMLIMPLGERVAYKSATKGNATYTMSCLNEFCRVHEEKWPFIGLIDGINVTRTAKGQCRRLNYTGTLYEERGALDPKAFSRFIEGLSGNYTAYVCEVNGVMLSANLTATASAHGEMISIILKIEAVKAGPYRPDVYRLILNEIKAQ
jgi:hypothetical protein